MSEIRDVEVVPAYAPLPPLRTAPYPVPPPRRVGSAPRTHILLFFLTFLTTTMAGALHVGVDPLRNPLGMIHGIPFSFTLMLILLCHELGHYTLAAVHRVPATLPYFIPGPPFLVGTFGAFIKMHGMPRSRRALFDVGAAGPWAGFIVAVPAVILGLSWSQVRPLGGELEGGLSLGNSILFATLSRTVLGVHPDDVTILLHPVALAGWFGIFVTFLNLLPIGQLDGGHIALAMFGRRAAQVIGSVAMWTLLLLGLFVWPGLLTWALIIFFIAGRGAPPLDDFTPLTPERRVLGFVAFAILALILTPLPRTLWGGAGTGCPYM